jgi:hypothetical protein
MSSVEIKKCENTFCKEYYKQVKKISDTIIKLTVEKCKNMDVKNTKEIKLKIKEMKDKIKSRKFKEESMKLCKNSFCNPGCKGTIFQNNKFPKELVDKFSKHEDGEMTLKLLKKMRKNLFKGKKTILKNGFYEELPVKKLKKKGAVSGCAIASLL